MESLGQLINSIHGEAVLGWYVAAGLTAVGLMHYTTWLFRQLVVFLKEVRDLRGQL